MKFRRFDTFLLACLFAVHLLIAEEGEFSVFRSEGWSEGWSASGFSGVSAEKMADENGKAILKIKVSENTKDWAGVFFRSKKPFRLESTGSDAFLVFWINGDHDAFGASVGSQKIQINLMNGGKSLSKDYLSLGKYTEGNAVDSDGATWQKVIVPFSSLGKVEPPIAVDQIALQFIGAAPTAGVLLKNIFFTSEEPPKEKPTTPSSVRKINLPDPIFPEFRELSSDLLIPKNPTVSVDKDGNYVVDGKVRFLLGTQLETELATGFAHRTGYDEKYNWIYDLAPDYERALRLGFDTMGFFTPSTWTRKYNPKAFASGSGTLPEDEKAFDAFVKNIQLPLYVDMTCFPWAHGILSGKNGAASEDSKSSTLKNHFLPYSIAHPDGVALYKEMAAAIAKRVLENGGAPLFYELFNEPGYTDDNAYNRGVFVAWLVAKYKTISKLNEVWASHYATFEDIASFKSSSECLGLYVDWCKFLESRFTQLTLETKAAVRAVDVRKDARFTVQVMGMNYYRKLPATGVNLYEVLKNMEVVSTPTGGGIGRLGVGLTTPPAHTLEAGNLTEKEGIAMARFLGAISEGKPIHDGEFYGPNDPKDLVNAWWLELARGYSASYLFKWDKRAWDWKDEKEGRKKAEQYDYLWLNPYAKSVSTFPGIITFKKEFKTVEDLLVPKARNIKTEIAVLLSFPTERASDINLSQHNELISYAAALEFSHFPYDVIPEEEIHAGKLSRYKVLVFAGVRNLYPETIPFLEKFISEGGTVAMALDLPAFNEYDQPLLWNAVTGLELGDKLKSDNAPISMNIPQWTAVPGAIKALPFKEIRTFGEWNTLASVPGAATGKTTPVLLGKKVGKGNAFFINAKFSDYALAAILGSLLDRQALSRPFEIRDAQNGELPPNVEIHGADRGLEKVVFLFNWDLHSKLVYLKLPGLAASSASDPLSRERYEVGEKGVLIHLPPQERKLIVFGKSGSPRQDFSLKSETEVAASFQAARKNEIDNLAARNKSESEKEKGLTYPVNLAKIKTIDIRSWCNRAFEDSKPGDGKGGWTDQGENSLRGVPDGIQNFLGVPFDIIRWDMNGDRSCLVLGSVNSKGLPVSVTDIPVEEKMKSLFFVQACAWATSGKEALRYRIRYQDGTSLDLPMIVGTHLDDWWLNKNIKEARIAWKNSENKGFYVWRWDNPSPEKRIRSIDILSAQGEVVPIVIAITGEIAP